MVWTLDALRQSIRDLDRGFDVTSTTLETPHFIVRTSTEQYCRRTADQDRLIRLRTESENA